MAYSDRTVMAESGGDPNATNPNSSATGLGQFIDGTWLGLMRRYKPDMIVGMSDADVLALRKDPNLSREMVDIYGNENGGILSKAGLPVTDGTKYLAHFAGPSGALGILKADPNAPAGSILGEAAVRANPWLSGMTASQLASWADKKVGGRAAPLSMAGPARGGGGAAPVADAGPVVDQPTQSAPQQAVPARASEPDLSGLFDAPKLPSILTPRPRLSLAAFKPAPFSFRGMR